MKQQIILNDRVSDSCKIINPKEYYLDKECSICFDIPDTTLKCGHVFHNSCLIKYIKSIRKTQEQEQVNPVNPVDEHPITGRIRRRLSQNIITIQCPICRAFIF